jgi:hypothetical protein
MHVFHRSAMLTLGLMWIFPLAAAQGQQACEVDEGKPSQVARATLAVQMASGAQDPAAVSRQLTSAVRMLTDRGEQMANQVGRNFVLGKALVLWSIQPNVPLVTTRGAVGFATNPQGTVDLAVAIDSAFKRSEGLGGSSQCGHRAHERGRHRFRAYRGGTCNSAQSIRSVRVRRPGKRDAEERQRG